MIQPLWNSLAHSGEWTYPSSKAVLKETGLRSIAHYVQVRRQTIAAFILNRPIFSMCRDAERIRGSPPKQFWWEQAFDFDLAREAAGVATGAGEEGDEGSLESLSLDGD